MDKNGLGKDDYIRTPSGNLFVKSSVRKGLLVKTFNSNLFQLFSMCVSVVRLISINSIRNRNIFRVLFPVTFYARIFLYAWF